MTKELLEKEFENRNLKHQVQNLVNQNKIVRKQLDNLTEHFEERIDNEVNLKTKEITKKMQEEKRRADIAESLKQRLEKKYEKKLENTKNKSENIINEKDREIEALKNKIVELTKRLELAEYERNKYLSQLNLDGTNSGIPTSMTPINKKKAIPNTREKTGKSIGGQRGHKKHKLEKFRDEEINEVEEIKLDECPHCHSKELNELNTSVTKDEFDYEIKIIKKRYYFKEYECNNCHQLVRKNIPKSLKEENQYGNKVQATALTLANIGNVPMNKVRKIIKGLTINEIDLTEGYIAKLQKRASDKLKKFIEDIKFKMVHLKLLYWDDTVIMINTKRGCMRFYGNETLALYCAHEQKNSEGLDEDNILNLLTKETTVEHDHNIINYNEKYCFTNAECCQHLIRDLEKVSVNIPNRTWSKKTKELFQKYDHKRKELMSNNIDHFEEEELNDFIIEINQLLLLGFKENTDNPEVYYASDEKALINRIMVYRDNYLYWLYDFDLPFTNNLSERSLRGIKSKMKVSGQFQNVTNAKYYATIKSYIETCYRNGINEHEALVRLMENNPYTLEEILKFGEENTKRNKNN